VSRTSTDTIRPKTISERNSFACLLKSCPRSGVSIPSNRTRAARPLRKTEMVSPSCTATTFPTNDSARAWLARTNDSIIATAIPASTAAMRDAALSRAK
jgi:hypothetical protein